MSFGEGNLRLRCARLEEELSRLQQANEKLLDVNGALCAEVNEKDEQIRKRDELIRDMHKLLRLSAELPATVSGIELTEQRIKALGIELDTSDDYEGVTRPLKEVAR